MGKIRSSLEIALERTESVTGSREEITAYEHRQRGKQAVGLALGGGDGEYDIAEATAGLGAGEAAEVHRGMRAALLPQIALPADEPGLERFAAIGKIINVMTGGSGGEEVASALEELGYAYLQERQQIIRSVRQQYEQVAQEKMAQVARQTGMEVRLDPSTLPEFQQDLQRHLSGHQGGYQQRVDAVKEQVARLLGDESGGGGAGTPQGAV